MMTHNLGEITHAQVPVPEDIKIPEEPHARLFSVVFFLCVFPTWPQMFERTLNDVHVRSGNCVCAESRGRLTRLCRSMPRHVLGAVDRIKRILWSMTLLFPAKPWVYSFAFAGDRNWKKIKMRHKFFCPASLATKWRINISREGRLLSPIYSSPVMVYKWRQLLSGRGVENSCLCEINSLETFLV